MEKQKGSITNWEIEDHGDVYTLTGVVLNHPLLPEGMAVRTSALEKINFKEKIAETKNTIYTLM